MTTSAPPSAFSSRRSPPSGRSALSTSCGSLSPLSEADAPEAIDALLDAELITVDAFQQAADAAIAELSQGWRAASVA